MNDPGDLETFEEEEREYTYLDSILDADDDEIAKRKEGFYE